MKAKRTDKVLFIVFLFAVVFAVLVAVFVVFDPAGTLGVRNPAKPRPPLPRTPGLQDCVNEYSACAPSLFDYEGCVNLAKADDENCRRVILPGDPERYVKIHRCGSDYARDLVSCGELACQGVGSACKALSDCDTDLVRCVDRLPGNEDPYDPPSPSPRSSPSR